MALLLIGTSLEILSVKTHIENFETVKTLYSPYWTSLPKADFPFSLHLDTLDNIPWTDFSGLIVCAGVRTSSLALEIAHKHSLPAFALLPDRLYFQAPHQHFVDIPISRIPAYAYGVSSSLLSYLNKEQITRTENKAWGDTLKERSQEHYINGTYCDLISVACSADTSSVSSSETLELSLRDLAEEIHLTEKASLKRSSPLFIELEWKKKRLMIYRQGRVSLTPCEEQEEVFFSYQFFINS